MLVHDKNPGNEVLAECFVELGEKVRLIAKDNGEILDLTDPDMEIGSLRVYLISMLMDSHTTRRGALPGPEL